MIFPHCFTCNAAKLSYVKKMHCLDLIKKPFFSRIPFLRKVTVTLKFNSYGDICKFETHFYSSICQTRRILFAEHMLLTSSPSVCLSVNLPEIEFSSCNKLSCLNLKMVVKLHLPIAKQTKTWKKGEHNFQQKCLEYFG